MIAQYVKLSMIPSGVMPTLYVSQYDVGRPLGLIVTNGTELVNMDSYSVTIEATRSDGTQITAAVTTADNIGTFQTTATMTNVAGIYKTQLVIAIASGKRIASIPFLMNVTAAAMDENGQGIAEDQSLYQQYTGTVQTLIATIRADLNTEIANRQSAVSAEAAARQTADNTLQSNINSEASTRAAADQNLQAQISQIVAPSGEAPSAAEVQNARVGADGVTYPTLGDAIRANDSQLKSQINANAASITNLSSHKVNIPLDDNSQPTNGTNGQTLRTKGNGATEWANVGLPTDEQTAQAVSDWLDDHPEATTTVDFAVVTKVFQNVTRMTEDLTLEEGDTVRTCGYYAVNDGGGALYRIYSTAPATHYEALSNGLYAMLIMGETVAPEQFGAYGDGTTDDSTAIQNAIDNASGKSVLFSKMYAVASTIANNNGVSLIGISGATIKCTAPMTDMLSISRYEVNSPHIISGLTFDGNQLCNNGITVNYCSNIVFENCRTRNFKNRHVNLLAGYECFMRNLYARNTMPYDSNNPVTAYYIKTSDSVFENCVSVNFDIGFDVNTNVFLIGCHPWNNDTDFIKNSTGIKTKANPYIIDCELDNCKYGVYVSGYYAVRMDNCRFIFGSTIPDFTNTYIYLETGTLSYTEACFFGKSGSTCTLCSRPQSLSVIGAVFGSGATFTDTYTNRRLLMSSDERYQLIIADGSSFSLNAGATVTKTYAVPGIKAFDSIVCNAVYDTSGIVYKVVPQADAIKVICINPTDTTQSTSYARINVIVNHNNGGNVAYTWTIFSESVS